MYRWTEQTLNNLSGKDSGFAGIWAVFLPCCETCTCAYYSAARICVILPSCFFNQSVIEKNTWVRPSSRYCHCSYFTIFKCLLQTNPLKLNLYIFLRNKKKCHKKGSKISWNCFCIWHQILSFSVDMLLRTHWLHASRFFSRVIWGQRTGSQRR